MGIFGYDMVRELERLPRLDKPDDPVMPGPSVLMDFYSTVVAFDHVRHQIVLISHESQDRVDDLEERLRSAPQLSMTGGLTASDSIPEGSFRSSFSPSAFRNAVETAKEYIRAGDIFQVVLSQQFQTDFSGSPFDVYRALRYINPSPYLFYLKRGDLHVAGSSPEMLVRVQGRDLEYRPIAGTRRRGRHLEEEKKFEEELIQDEKERAEHLMLVEPGKE